MAEERGAARAVVLDGVGALGADGVPVTLPHKPRRLLAVLVAQAPHPVPVTALIEAVWGDAPPPSAPKTLQSYVVQLRRAGLDVTTRHGSYAYSGASDLAELEDLLTTARELRAQRQSLAEGAALDAALRLLAGHPFGELADLPPVLPVVTRLAERRLLALEDRTDVLLSCGEPGEAARTASSLLDEDPLRERAWGLLVRAQHEGGRPGDAIASYERARRVLREQLGVDPGPELTAAHQSVLGARTELPEDGTALWRGPVPEVRYALSGGGHVAHCVLGEGRDDLVVLGDWFNNVEVFWDHPVGEGALRRLGALGRVITLDPRGQGLSDRLDGPPSAATWAEDVLAVLDAVGSHRCVVFAPSSSTAAALALVRLCPERVRGLVVVNGMLNGVGTQLEMLGAPETSRVITSRWGFGPGLHGVASSHTGDPRFTSWFGRLMRSSLSPGEVEPWLRYATSLDCAAAAPDVRVRTLVVHREGDRVIPPDKGQELADALPDARLEIVPGADHAWFCGAVAPIVTATARFLAQLPR